MKRGLKQIIFLIILVVVIALVYFVLIKEEEQINYITEQVSRGDIMQTVNATGEVGAVQLVTVGAQASGQIETLYVKLGQYVKKGDMIADIDSTTQLNELNINKAKLQTYQSQLASRKVTLVTAQKQYNREANLWAKKATSQENLENAQDALALAKANVTETESLIKQTQISVNTAETNLGYTKIIAPLDGTIVSVPVEQGQTVNANQTTPTIVQIADLSTMEIKMQISEGDVTKVKPGMTVSYSILAEPTKLFSGTLDSIDPGLTTLTSGTYTGATDSSAAVYYYGNLVVPNKQGLLRIGMTTQNTIIIAQAKDVLVVPSITINGADGQQWVNVLKNNQVIRKEVVVGLSDNMNTQIISGLSVGDEVIADQMSSTEVSAASQSGSKRGPRM